MSVGVTKDYKLKVRNLHASHTLDPRDSLRVSVLFFLFFFLGTFTFLKAQYEIRLHNPGLRDGITSVDVYRAEIRSQSVERL